MTKSLKSAHPSSNSNDHCSRPALQQHVGNEQIERLFPALPGIASVPEIVSIDTLAAVNIAPAAMPIRTSANGIGGEALSISPLRSRR